MGSFRWLVLGGSRVAAVAAFVAVVVAITVFVVLDWHVRVLGRCSGTAAALLAPGPSTVARNKSYFFIYVLYRLSFSVGFQCLS